MTRLRLKIRGLHPRKTREKIAQERARLDHASERLARTRADHANRLMRLDNEAEELKRQVEEARSRIRNLRQERSSPEDDERSSPEDQGPPPAAATRARLGDRLVDERILSQAQLDSAMARQRDYGGRLGDILIDMGFATAEQLLPFLNEQPSKGRLGDMLVASGYISQEQLDKALSFQQKSGGLLGDVLLSLQMLEPEQLYRAIATQHSIGRIGAEISLDSQIRLPESMARAYGAVVVHQYVNRFLIAVNEPLDEERRTDVEKYLGMPVEQVLATSSEMEFFWKAVYEEELMHESTSKLIAEKPENSAHVTFTTLQKVFFSVSLFVLAGCLVWNWLWTLIVLNVAVQAVYFSMSVFKFAIILFGTKRAAQLRFAPEQIAAIDERELPVYTILVPMYKESSVIPHLLRNIEQLDYPKAKLDVRLLIEEDDVEAQELLRSMKLPFYYTVLVIPHSLPKTKPKACNYGLIRARGEYVVIYDAEDRPDSDQLKKVHLAFRSSPPECCCIQAKLNYFNSNQNMLTRWFTHEYSMWFELLLPGVMQLDIPIPLGGTSNHFKMKALKEINAWDPYNVTEDADLGIRLYKEGYKTAIVDSRTWEEANSRYGNWIRQRSRWIKGYMQTWLVHMRDPLKLWRDLGPKGFFGFQVMVFATPILPLLNPLFWLMIVLWYGAKLEIISLFFPGAIYYFSAIELFIGNFLFVYSYTAGFYWITKEMRLEGDKTFSFSLVKYTLLTPVYWIMISIAAVKAGIQLITKPFYWEKTTHGLTLEDHDAGIPGSPSV
ncbi:glycosyltransferase family 2 protein [Cohnella nanjingensis]|uniref:Glycosyltransferase n=1 Tax=Cohnella nanjingensis TaxID=1387779 RepID=A0A7X0RNZ8_9BACL|nr:glycosyltransferase family 2 protein [Cohnella nanjingensis]MBB6669856.1 glycosyltransferase [Cohnella nanjingensis]